MALSDPQRALQLLREYRVHDEVNELVEAKNDAAGTYSIMTNLNEAAATALSKKIAADNVAPRLFSMDIEGLMWTDWFVGGPPQWRTVLAHDAVNKDMKGISLVCSFSTGQTKLEVRG